MDLNVKVDLEVSIKPESLEVLKGFFGPKETAFRVAAPVMEVPDEAAKVIEKAIEEEISPKSTRSRSNKANKPKAEEPEPAQADPEPAEEIKPEPEPAPAEEPEKVITIEDARAAATTLLKANPANRDKVAAALKACGANKLTEITEPANLKKFVELLEAK